MKWNDGSKGYDVSIDGNEHYLGDESLIREINNQYLGELQNPQEAIQRQERIYRGAMEPAFDQQVAAARSNLLARLGNRFRSAYGTLTMDKQALDEGTQRAQLEKEIYDAGQDNLDKRVNRSTQLGNLYTQTQARRMKPYETLGGLVAQGSYGQTSYNNALSNIYSANSRGRDTLMSGLFGIGEKVVPALAQRYLGNNAPQPIAPQPKTTP